MRTRSLLLPGILTVLALGLFVTVAGARDLLEEAKAKQAVEAQRLEKLVRDNRSEAGRLFKVRPTDALELLKGTITTLEGDTVLKEDRRASLIRSVKLEIKDMEIDIRERKTRPQADIDRFARSEEERRRAAETESIRRSQSDIRALQNTGRNDEARRLYDDLVRRFPTNPALKAGSTISGREGAISAQSDLKRQREEGTLLVYRDTEKAMRMPIGDVEFPRDWAEKSARRTKNNNITDKERAIMKALNTVIEVDFDKNTFQEVIDYLEKKTGQPLIVDKQAMTEANVTYDSQVTLKVKTTVRTILKKLLADLNLAYVIKDESIQVTSIQRAKETLSMRTYYVGDLVTFGDFRFGPYMARAQMAQQVAQLAVLITQTVDTDSWMVNDRGGLGTIAFNPLTMSFVVRQTAEVHYRLGLSMR
jgi:hypothetical protein